MERVPPANVEAFFEANKGNNVLRVIQTVLTSEFKHTTYEQDLIVASPNELKLSEDIYSTFYIFRLSDGQEIRQLTQGLRLENSILHLAKTGQVVLIFDTDDLNFPYLAYLESKKLLAKPFNFTQLDAHVDIDNMGSNFPKARDIDTLLKFHQKSVGIANFLSALSAGGYLTKINHANHSKLMGLGGTMPPEVYSNIKKHGVEFNFINPYFWFFNKFTRVFKNSDSGVLAFDIDFFGAYAEGVKKPVLEVTKNWLLRLKDGGYTSKKAPVVMIATSPGFNEGYKDDMEKLEVVNQIVEELSLK